ncbi:MAG: response regulator transcription factor [Candidatus Omnitrophica bacterium]|nr:response regulator transcription factor [Candidatus Omnitrophota bacterium]
MPDEKILLIEDEKNIVELLKYNLEKEGFRVSHVTRGDEALDAVLKVKPALVILDLMLPGLNGLEVCKILRANEKTARIPLVMLTAKSEETDKVLGLELGADDYVTKPFSPRELVARLRALLRRSREKPKQEVVKAGTLEVDFGKHVVTLKGKTVEMTSKEFDLLGALVNAQGRVLTRDFLLESVWGYDASIQIETRTIDMHIGQLRKKLKAEAERIVTVKNVGYRFDFEK